MSSGIGALEHPIQDWWIPEGNQAVIQGEHLVALERRFSGKKTPEGQAIPIEEIADAINWANLLNHTHRFLHERDNLGRLGLDFNVARAVDDLAFTPSPEYDKYESCAGRYSKAGEFITWFGQIAHRVFGEIDQLPGRKPFDRISLELGGTRQFGDWESTRTLDSMIRDIPRQVMAAEPDARITVYGRRDDRKGEFTHPNVTYVNEGEKSYLLVPQMKRDESGIFSFDYAMIRRRRPLADIEVPIIGETHEDGSQVFEKVIAYKEAIGVGVLKMMNPGVRRAIILDYVEHVQELASKEKEVAFKKSQNIELTSEEKDIKIKLLDTKGARMVGIHFERGIKAAVNETTDIIPTSAHALMGVGEKFAQIKLGRVEN